MLRCGEPATNGESGNEERKEKGGESSWKRMTSPVQWERGRETGKQREGVGGGRNEACRERGGAALDGLAAEQMWMKERDGRRRRMGETEIQRKARGHLY